MIIIFRLPLAATPNPYVGQSVSSLLLRWMLLGLGWSSQTDSLCLLRVMVARISALCRQLQASMQSSSAHEQEGG